MNELEGEEMVTIKKWARDDIDNALSYYQKIGWCPKTTTYINDLKSLIVVFRKVDKNIIKILDGFMKDKRLIAFLVVHAVFNVDALTNGDKIELYMANKIAVSNSQIEKMFSKEVPEDIKKLLMPFEVEPIRFDVQSYRVEFGSRGRDPDTGRYNHDSIRVIDTTLDQAKGKVDNSVFQEEFIDQYEDIVL